MPAVRDRYIHYIMSAEKRDFSRELSHLIRMGRVFASIEHMNRRAKAQETEGQITLAGAARFVAEQEEKRKLAE